MVLVLRRSLDLHMDAIRWLRGEVLADGDLLSIVLDDLRPCSVLTVLSAPSSLPAILSLVFTGPPLCTMCSSICQRIPLPISDLMDDRLFGIILFLAIVLIRTAGWSWSMSWRSVTRSAWWHSIARKCALKHARGLMVDEERDSQAAGSELDRSRPPPMASLYDANQEWVVLVSTQMKLLRSVDPWVDRINESEQNLVVNTYCTLMKRAAALWWRSGRRLWPLCRRSLIKTAPDRTAPHRSAPASGSGDNYCYANTSLAAEVLGAGAMSTKGLVGAGASTGAIAIRNATQKSLTFSNSLVETAPRVRSLHRDFLRSVPWIKRAYGVRMPEKVPHAQKKKSSAPLVPRHWA